MIIQGVLTMKMTFRWYGDSDPVTLDYIRQIPGMTGIVSAIYDVPVGGVWPMDKINALKSKIEAKGMTFEVVESVPVHEDIKLGKPSWMPHSIPRCWKPSRRTREKQRHWQKKPSGCFLRWRHCKRYWTNCHPISKSTRT